MTDLDIKYYNHFWQCHTISLPINRIFRKGILLVVLLIFNHLGHSQALKLVSSSVTFKIKHAFGSTAEGNFKGLESSIFFDTNQLNKSSLRISLEARTINTGLGLRDKTLKGSKYLDVEHFPKIRIASSKVEPTSREHEYLGTFEIEIRDKVKILKIPFTFISTDTNGQFRSTFQINRLDFGVGDSSALLGETVTIMVILNTIAI